MVLLEPRKVKYRKWQKGRIRRIAQKGNKISFGQYGLKALEQKWIRAQQIESARKSILRVLKGKGKLWIRIFPQKPVTFKGVEVPMGGGKGSVAGYVFPVEPGRIIFELDGIPEEVAKEAFRKASHKLPIKTKFVKKEL